MPIMYPDYAARFVNDLAQHLAGSARTFQSVLTITEVTPEGHIVWMPVDSAHKGTITDAPTVKVTHATAIGAARRLLQRVSSQKQYDDMPEPEKMGRKAIAKRLAQSNGAPVTNALKRAKREGMKARKAARQQTQALAAKEAGNYFTLTGKQFAGRVFASEKLARKVYAKAVFGPNWWCLTETYENAKGEMKERPVKADDGKSSVEHPDKALRLAEAPVVAHGNKALKTVAAEPVSTATPTATVSAKQAKQMAAAMGGTGADVKTKAAAVAYLASKGITL